MQNPSEDTQWNDALRRHGILPEKEVSEDQLIDLVEETVQQKTGNVVKAYEDMTLEELEARFASRGAGGGGPGGGGFGGDPREGKPDRPARPAEE